MAPRKKASGGKANRTQPKSAAKRAAPKTIAAESAQTLREGASRSPASEAPAVQAPALVGTKAQGKTFGDTAATMHRGFAGTGLGMLAVNRKLMAMMRDNVSSSLALARGMARAETPVQSMQLQIAFWRDRVGAFATQAQELRALMTGAVEGR